MEFEKKDVSLQRAIVQALWERYTINLNKETGVAYFQAESEDKINPCVMITRDEIRNETGRQKVRDVVLDDYEEALRRPGIDVTRPDSDTIKICLTPVRARENEFSSLTTLRKKNANELDNDPELA